VRQISGETEAAVEHPENDDRVDRGMEIAFRRRRAAGRESVLDGIEQATGVRPRVLLRDDPGEHSPLLRVGASGEESAHDDSRYRIVGEIARGGVGVIFKGRDAELGRDVALKVLRKDLAEHPEVVQRFVEEAQVEGQLQHPGIIPVYGLGLQPDGRPFFAMKLVKGRTLAALLAERQDPSDDLARFLPLFEQVCQAVAYAHARGVIHRDLKPSNVLVGSFGEVLVVDWGFAKVLDRRDESGRTPPPLTTIVATVRSQEGSSHSVAGSVMGTPAYMPPEQALGHVDMLDERSDVFALGAILTEILTGRPPYEGETKDQLVLAAQARLDDAHARLDGCGADASLVELARRSLSPASADRPANAGVVAAEVTKHLAEAEERARQAEIRAVEERAELERERQHAAWARRARGRTRIVAAALLLAFLAGGGSFLWLKDRRAARGERTATRVAEVMERAERLRGEKQWGEALQAAKEAADATRAGDADDQLRLQTRALLAAVEEEKRAADEAARAKERDDALAERLQGFRHATENVLIPEHVPAMRQQHANDLEAFREWGLDLENTNVSEAAERIRSSTRAGDVVDAIDGWSQFLLSDLPEEYTGFANRLVAIADAVDSDPASRRLRSVLRSGTPEELLSISEEIRLRDFSARKVNQLALRLMAKERNAAARTLLQRAVAIWPGDFFIRKNLGILSPGQQGILHLTAALALHQDASQVWGTLGARLSNVERHDEALDAFARAIDIQPAASTFHLNQGITLAKMGRPREAIEAYNEALALDPENATIWYQRGVARYALRDFANAVEDWKRCAELDVEDPRPHNNMGAVFCDFFQEHGKGYEAFKAALARAPHEPMYHGNLGNALLGMGELDKAERAFRECIELEPTQIRGRKRLALTLLHKGDPLGGIKVLEKARDIDPRDAETRFLLSGAFEARDRYPEALREARAAIRLDPDYPKYRYQLSTVLEHVGRYALAVLRHEEALANAPPWLRPIVLEARDRCALARELSERLPELLESPDSVSDPAELRVLARVCFTEERYAAAAFFHQRVLELLGDQATPLDWRNAALMALDAGFGRGVDADTLDETARTEWRRRSRRDLRRLLDMAVRALENARSWLASTRQDRHFLISRDEAELAKLPPEEREAWRKLWADIDALFKEGR
jgi:serine/threonine-protein kinase